MPAEFGGEDENWQDEDFIKEDLPSAIQGLSFSSVASWRRVGEWAAEQGFEEVVVAAPPGASEEEVDSISKP